MLAAIGIMLDVGVATEEAKQMDAEKRQVLKEWARKFGHPFDDAVD